MKADLHPDYSFKTVRLADGTTFQTRSTMKGDSYVSEVDSSNHPFYTGKKTLMDTAGRVEKFRRRYGIQEAAAPEEAAADAPAPADEAAAEASAPAADEAAPAA